MSKPSWPLIDANAITDSFESLKKGLVLPMQRALGDLRAMMTNGLTFSENMNAAIVTLGRPPGGSQPILTHGAEYLLSNPLRSSMRPIGFFPISATDSNGVAVDVETSCKLNLSRTDGLIGVTCNFPGNVGEQIRSFGSSGAQTTTVNRNVASVSLTAGTWDISAVCGLVGAPGGFSLFLVSITPTSATNNGVDGDSRVWFPTAPNGSSDITVTIPQYRVTLASTTTYYLVARADFTVATCNSYGRLSAVRVAVDAAKTGVVTGILVGG